jgi:hypothetical protein
VTTPPLEGLGSSIEQLKRLVRDDPEALDLLDQAITGKPGGANNPHGRAGKPPTNEINHNNVSIDYVPESSEPSDKPIQGNGSQYALRKNRPDLHAMVLNEELSPHCLGK